MIDHKLPLYGAHDDRHAGRGPRDVHPEQLATADFSLLQQSRFDNSRDAEMIALTTVDLLILDDFALEPMTKEESKDVYQLFLERTGRGSIIVTSNRDAAEWLAMFDDVLLARSALEARWARTGERPGRFDGIE